MAAAGGGFDHVLLQDVETRWVRDGAVAAGGFGVAAAVFFYLGFDAAWPVASVGFVVVLAAGVTRRRPPSAARLAFVAAVGLTAAAPWADPMAVPGLVAAIAMAGTIGIAAFEPPRFGLLLTAALLALLAGAQYLAEPGLTVVFVLGPIAGASVVTRPLLATMRDRLVERGEAVRSHDLRFRDLFDRMPVGLYRTGPSGEVLDANPALAELLGTDRDELIGQPVQPYLLDSDDLGRIRSNVATDPGTVVTDIRMVRRDGRLIWVRDRTRAVRDENGEVKWYEGELQDISAQVEQVERLESLVRSKSELIAAVSHELRTPLTAVVGFLDLLAGDGQPDLEEKEALLELAAEEAHDLTAIVEDLLTAARLDNSELVIKSDAVDVADLVAAAVRSMGSPMTIVHLQPDLQVRADGNRVRQILRNLIGNAQRYGAEPLHVFADEVDGLARIIVADRGEQIPDDVAEQMFEPFFSTGRSTTNSPGSIGLGLAVSRRLAGLMHGTLRYERLDTQNRFILELPLAGHQAEKVA